MGNLETKKQVVAEVTEKFSNAKSVIITDYRGLTVAEVTELRSRLRAQGVEYRVIKNTLLKIAAKDAGIEGAEEYFQGPTAVAYGLEDAVAPAQVLSKFIKEYKKMEIKGGILEGKVIGFDEVKALADLPPREILLGQVASVFQAPIAGLVNVLQGPIRKLGYALEEVRKLKEQEA
ncbi:MAG: 50S ribosomal protein L10 [Clostridia bacterium]|nr:50S ribosomal protein L10 [Clostridia bacterium]